MNAEAPLQRPPSEIPAPSDRCSRFRVCRYLFSVIALTALAVLSRPARAQAHPIDLGKRLIGHPLYLRDAWQEDTLEFDGRGQPVHPTEAHRGPVTLSGIDVSDVSVHGDQLRMHGTRVALIAPAPGSPLQRATSIGSTTLLAYSLRRGDKRFFRATERVQITVHANAKGSFDEALDAIFADGLAQLAPSVPAFWRCYAAAYFIAGPPSAHAADDVQHCASTQSPAVHFKTLEPDSFHPPEVAQSFASRFTRAAAELRLAGESEVYVTVERNGLPSEFQVIQPIGAGLDEETLLAAAHFTFRAASLDGKPVRSGFLVQIQYGAHP